MLISDCSSDVCSSDLALCALRHEEGDRHAQGRAVDRRDAGGQLIMALKHYNPTSPSRRGLILIDRTGLHKGGPVKALTEGKRKTGRRTNKGHVTTRGIAGGHNKRHRFIEARKRNRMN